LQIFFHPHTITILALFVNSFCQTGLWYIAHMRFLFVADGRSPTSLSWISAWIKPGYETHLISTFPCDPPQGLASFHILPVAFGAMAGGQAASSQKKSITAILRKQLRPFRTILGPASLPFYQTRFRSLVRSIQPDLVHAMRIPFEGMLASVTPTGTPLVISIWGNDLTLHALTSIWMRQLTRRTLRRADGLLVDAHRDLRLGAEWGFPPTRPSLVVPGNGGIRMDIFYPPAIPQDPPVVFNPRGFRDYVRNDTFFRCIPLVLEKQPDALFKCASMADHPEALSWLDRLKISASVQLLPPCTQLEMAGLFRSALIAVSPSTHDGTPNSLLEAMACGCFPIAGDLESLREWITPGENGLLIDPSDPQALAGAILSALAKRDLIRSAGIKNARIIAERANYETGMVMVEAFYRKFMGRSD
jgi:glycosyltransferase involved in cell wall biosynthesis